MRFSKYHGLGNDFIIPERQAVARVDATVARAMCDRRFGIGADGVLLMLPSERAALRMVIFNADGSIPEMCGNGIRCLVKHALDEGFVKGPAVAVETGNGVLMCAATTSAQGRVETVSVEMGAPRFERAAVGIAGEGTFIRQALRAAEREFEVTAVSMGNPHAVIFGPGGRELARAVGPAIETLAMFANKTNVEFAGLHADGAITVDVWERGCGITLACGTGACATAAAACKLGLREPGTEYPVHLPGGTLHITVHKNFAGVTMRGPAIRVFDGDYPG